MEAKETLSPHEVRLNLLETNPVFQDFVYNEFNDSI